MVNKIKQKALKEYAEKVMVRAEEKVGENLDESLRVLLKSIIMVVYKDSEDRTLAEVKKKIDDCVWGFEKQKEKLLEKFPSGITTNLDNGIGLLRELKKELGI